MTTQALPSEEYLQNITTTVYEIVDLAWLSFGERPNRQTLSAGEDCNIPGDPDARPETTRLDVTVRRGDILGVTAQVAVRLTGGIGPELAAHILLGVGGQDGRIQPNGDLVFAVARSKVAA